ncbi:hypothetical protein ETAA8_53440 [Anatilimnocola aggregata]|uniref:Uncharacterized protein n=1 Tax=Anatilimnocola aggregata TaxID=2528021 RepID=A0A517YJ41_9BACT|nr:hypothetical protein [Anatilimnocola aggregata]QDU30225.1 hypothetical protein ETAA8_53440 [Anatilimnocola aggregata]
MSQDINVLALVKGEERYIFLFDDDRRAEALRTLGRFASNPELSFSWYDAAVLSQRIRSTVPESEAAEEAKAATTRTDAGSAAVPAPHRPRFKLSLPTDSATDSTGEEA